MAGAILVVDDSATMRMIVRATLNDAGWEVVLAADGAQALALVQTQPFTLVVTDWNMPVMGGAELVAALRADARFVALPVLVLTTEGDESAQVRAENLGVSGWLSKPVDPETLLAAVDHLQAKETP